MDFGVNVIIFRCRRSGHLLFIAGHDLVLETLFGGRMEEPCLAMIYTNIFVDRLRRPHNRGYTPSVIPKCDGGGEEEDCFKQGNAMAPDRDEVDWSELHGGRHHVRTRLAL